MHTPKCRSGIKPQLQATNDPMDVTRRFLVRSRGMTMRLCPHAFAVAAIFLTTPSMAGPSAGSPLAGRAPVILVSNETKAPETDTDIFALMSGRCSILKIAGRDFACKAVAYFHSEKGRANFTVALDDPSDESHVVAFSGENASRREQDNLYELQIDRMLLNSKDRPKVDGLPVPSAELSAGICRQVGNLAALQVSSVSCSATDRNGKKYELQFESDGSPITLRKIRQLPLTSENRRARQNERRECRHKADVARILPRDWTAYILRCLGEDSEPAPAANQ
jgi:hypothetical protein